MIKLYTTLKNMSIYSQVLVVHIILYVIVAITLIIAFNWKLLLAGLIVGWLLFCIGVSISLHRYTSHKTFEPKNRIIKILLLWAGVQCTLGSVHGFAGAHRHHHKNSDTNNDPFRLTNSFWHNFKLWLYYFPPVVFTPRSIFDLLGDNDIKFSHVHYWKIWLIYPLLILFLGGPIYFAYFVAIPIVYVITGMGYVTVIAHSHMWKQWINGTSEYKTNDLSWDSKLFTLLYAGEGFHHSHHANQRLSDLSIKGKQFDISGFIIKQLKKD